MRDSAKYPGERRRTDEQFQFHTRNPALVSSVPPVKGGKGVKGESGNDFKEATCKHIYKICPEEKSVKSKKRQWVDICNKKTWYIALCPTLYPPMRSSWRKGWLFLSQRSVGRGLPPAAQRNLTVLAAGTACSFFSIFADEVQNGAPATREQ